MRFIATCVAAAFAISAQSTSPQPFARFTPGTLAQDLAITPKGDWTYIVGSTTDIAYPVTADAFDRTCGTDGACNPFQGRFGIERRADVVLTVFDAAGRIAYSTFLGGAGFDDNPRLALARDGTLWLAGHTTSPSFEHGPEGCGGNLWIARFDYAIKRIDQFLCIGGPSLADIVLDTDGTLWVVGTTGIPAETRNAYQPNIAGQNDIYLARISPTESRPVLATYIGGDRSDVAARLAVTPAGDIAIVGSTTSRNFPLVRPLRSVPPPNVVRDDAVVLVMDRSGQFLEFSTQWGGSELDRATGVAVDAAGDLFVVGDTASDDMPVTAGAFDSHCDGEFGCRDAFLVRLTAVGQLAASTYFGGGALDSGREVALRPDGQVLVLGTTQSADFPLVGGRPFQRWRPAINFEHTWLATFDDHFQRLARSVYVGSEEFLPNVARMVERNGLAHIAGQVTTFTGAPAYGTYLTVVPVP